jgi:hypothetical protein
MNVRMKLLLVFAATWAVPFMAHAEEPADKQSPITALVEGRTLLLEPPQNTCVYDKSNPADAKILDLTQKSVEGTNQLVLAFADCRDLEAVRAGREAKTGYYGQIMFSTFQKNELDTSRAEFVSKMTDYFKTSTGVFEEKEKEVSDIVKNLTHDTLKINNSRILGVIRSDPDFVQVGMMQSLQTPQKAMFIVGVITSTKLGTPININLYHPSNGADSSQVMHDLSERSAAYARRLIALNPDAAMLPHADERVEDSHHWMGIIAGMLTLLGLGAIFMRLRSKRGVS